MAVGTPAVHPSQALAGAVHAHLDLPQAVEGFLQIFNGMAHW